MNIFINFIATYLIVLVFLPIAAYYFFVKKDYSIIFKLILAVIISAATQIIFNFLYFTPRPFMVNHLPVYVAIIPIVSSFPSGHTMIAFALSTIIFLKKKHIGVILFIISLIIGVGRVLANVHYPIDIFGGLILGVTIGAICGKITEYARHHYPTSWRIKI